MSNAQLYLSIGVPSVLVVLAWISNNVRLSAHDKRFDDMEQRFGKRFDDVIAAGHRDALEIMRSMTALHERMAVVEAKQELGR